MATSPDQKQAGPAALAALAGAALIGLAPIAVRVSELEPAATNLWRFLFALPILAAWAARAPAPSRRDLSWLLGAGVLFGIELNLWAFALMQTTIANATLLTNMTPVFAAAFGWFVFKERLGLGAFAGGAIALAGAVTLALARAQSGVGPADGVGWIGDTLALTAAVGYAGYLLIVRALGDRVSVGAVMLWGSLTGAAFTFVLCLFTDEALLPETWRGWAILMALGVVVQAAGQGLIAYGVGRLPIVVSTVLLWMQPVAAAALSWMIFEEALGPMALFGAGLVLAGIYIVQRGRAGAGA
ncbi:MAG TPA: DMT family transporter [Candidatus Binatia bacterium]|nr:DMT family transporter [Candidatus Binatia bacterium]